MDASVEEEDALSAGALGAWHALSSEARLWNTRCWLSSLLSVPLPEDVPFGDLVRSGALLARTSSALARAAASGTSSVPPVALREDEPGRGWHPARHAGGAWG